jgi:hypothetical protein
LLFQSRASLPSVIQLRLDDVRPGSIGEDVVLVLNQHEEELRRGALITIKGHRSRLRILPLKGSDNSLGLSEFPMANIAV